MSTHISSCVSMTKSEAESSGFDTSACAGDMTLIEYIDGHSQITFVDNVGQHHCRYFDENDEEVYYHIYRRTPSPCP